MIRDEYIRDAVVERVVDGDTLDLMVSLGFDTYKKIRVRLIGVNCPETRGSEKEKGLEAKAFVMKLALKTLNRVTVRTTEYKKGKYGRTLAELYSKYGGDDSTDITPMDINSWGSKIIASGHGVPTKK